MSKSNSDRSVRIFAALIFFAGAAAAAFFGIAVYEVFGERQKASERVEKLAADMDELKRKVEYQKNFHARFINDEAFAERVIRETLGYSAEGEIIFKFDEKTFSADNTDSVKVERGGVPAR